MSTNNDNEKEMNLWDLIVLFFRGIKKGCIGLAKAVGGMFRLTFQHPIVISLTLLLGLAAGLYLSRPSARVYKAEAMAWLNGPTAHMVKQVTKQLEMPFPKVTSETLSLATLLNIPDSVADNICRIESFHVIDYLNDSTADVVDFKRKHLLTDTLNVISPNHLYFRIRTKNVEELPVFETAFLNYLNSQPNLVQLYERHKNAQAQRQLAQAVELQRLDSLEKITYLTPLQPLQFRTNQYQLLIGEQRKQLLYDEIELVFQAQQRALPYQILCTAPVVLLDHFAASPKAVNNRLKMCFIGLCAGYALGLIIALFIKHWQQIIGYLRRK